MLHKILKFFWRGVAATCFVLGAVVLCVPTLMTLIVALSPHAAPGAARADAVVALRNALPALIFMFLGWKLWLGVGRWGTHSRHDKARDPNGSGKGRA